MKKSLFIAALGFGVFANVNAKTFDLDVTEGNTLKQTLHLEKNDVVALHTSVPVGSPFQVWAAPADLSDESVANFNFVSSLGGVQPERYGEITDLVFAGANPGWLSYTFVGENPTDAVFQIFS